MRLGTLKQLSLLYTQRTSHLCLFVTRRHFSCLNTNTSTTSHLLTKDAQLNRFNRHIATEQTFLSGFWQTLSSSTPVSYVQSSLIQIHDITGLPWWGSIILSTVLFRTVVTLPLAIYQANIVARIERITLEMPEIVAELKKETAIAKRKFNWSEKQAKVMYLHSLKKQWNNLIIRDNCHPAKTLIVLWGQIPLWIFQSVAIRNLIYMMPDPSSLDAQLTYMELTLGGFGWIPNLTEVDSSFILPVALGIINLTIIEVQGMLRTKPLGRLQKLATNVFRVFGVVMIPIACTVPSALVVYWTTSSSYGLLQNMLLVSPKFRRLVRIPQTPSELQYPYQQLQAAIKTRIGKIPLLTSNKLSDNSGK